jgi:hypothetical protein
MDLRSIGFIAAFAIAASGCEVGACYYSCCTGAEGEDCQTSCLDDSKNAETCAVDAQATCESAGGALGNVEWDEISDLYCDSCSAVACAPEWWTTERLAPDVDSDSDTATDTAVDGGAT